MTLQIPIFRGVTLPASKHCELRLFLSTAGEPQPRFETVRDSFLGRAWWIGCATSAYSPVIRLGIRCPRRKTEWKMWRRVCVVNIVDSLVIVAVRLSKLANYKRADNVHHIHISCLFCNVYNMKYLFRVCVFDVYKCLRQGSMSRICRICAVSN